MTSFVGTSIWLGIAGPLVAVVLAHRTGGLTWTRVLVWAAGSQLVLVLLYLATQSMPVRVYGDEMPSTGEVAAAKARFAALTVMVGMVIAAVMTPIARRLVRT